MSCREHRRDLELAADAQPHDPVRLQAGRAAGRRSATPPDLRRQLAGQHVEGRGLAGAVRADHAIDAGPIERERQPVEDPDLADAGRRRRRRSSRATPGRRRPRRRGDAGVAARRRRRPQAALERREARRRRPCGNSSTTAMKTTAMRDLPEAEAIAQLAGQRADARSRPATGPSSRPRPPTAAQITRSAEG